MFNFNSRTIIDLWLKNVKRLATKENVRPSSNSLLRYFMHTTQLMYVFCLYGGHRNEPQNALTP